MLFVNGIPVATAELKNPLTGQNVEHASTSTGMTATRQNVTLARRCVVHFAVDPDNVTMTTQLTGASTQFLPFNQGSGGPGQQGGAGNPPNPRRHRTAYLWERGLAARRVARPARAGSSTSRRRTKGSAAEKRAGSVHRVPPLPPVGRCPRARGARARAGAGTNYLVQHSAGSGKSNTIAWLAHRLSSPARRGRPEGVRQGRGGHRPHGARPAAPGHVYQFEHAHGVVVKIDKDSQQLADALAGEQARIIITTLQKFPFVPSKVGDAAGTPLRGDRRRGALVADRARPPRS